MRGTLHLIAAQDLGWLVALHGPHFVRRSRPRYAQLGLDEKAAAKSIDRLCAILSDGDPLTR